MDRQTERQIIRWMDGQTDEWTDRHSDSQVDRQTDCELDVNAEDLKMFQHKVKHALYTT